MNIDNKYTKIIIISIIMLIIDIFWIYLYMGNKYNILIENIQKSPMVPRFIYAIFAYVFMILGLNIFVLPNLKKTEKIYSSFKYGFLFGVILYGVYDFTAAAVLKDWSIILSLIDILWGGFLFFILSIIYLYL